MDVAKLGGWRRLGGRFRALLSKAFVRKGKSPRSAQAIGGIKDGQCVIERHKRTFHQALAKTTHRLGGLKLVAMARGVMSDRPGVAAHRLQHRTTDCLEGTTKQPASLDPGLPAA